jgi:glycosyltransferase involved in cell wall biosynthesis
VDASVLVPVLNEESHLPTVVPAMLGQRFDGGLEFLFIDGGSTDGTVTAVEELAARDPRVRLLHNPRGHTPAALNIGLAAARGTYVVRMDAHSLYPDDYIARGVARLRRGGVDHVSGPQLPVGYDEGSRRIAVALRSALGGGGAGYRRATEEREVDTGFLGVWERRRVLDLGGWDEGAVINQDAELAARLRAAGGRLVCVPEMSAEYLPRNSLRGLARQYFRYGRYRARTALRHPQSMRRGHLLPPGVATATLAAVAAPRPLRRAARAGLAAYAVALAVESARLAATDDDARPADALALPAVFATMHLAWGGGVLVGIAQFAGGDGDAPRNSETISRPARAAV